METGKLLLLYLHKKNPQYNQHKSSGLGQQQDFSEDEEGETASHKYFDL
jgi:hypothetical protein